MGGWISVWMDGGDERALVEESTVWEGGVLCGWIEG